MTANPSKITATLAAGQFPPAALIHRNSPAIVPMITLSKAKLLGELQDIDIILAAAFLWLTMDLNTAECEDKIIKAQARLDALRKAVTGEDIAAHDAMCERAPGNTGR